MTNTHLEMTAETIMNMADVLEQSAKSLRDHREMLLRDGDLSRAAEVMNEIVNMIGALRLDLLVRRPLRAAGM